MLQEVMLHVELFAFAVQGDFGLIGRKCMGFIQKAPWAHAWLKAFSVRNQKCRWLRRSFWSTVGIRLWLESKFEEVKLGSSPCLSHFKSASVKYHYHQQAWLNTRDAGTSEGQRKSWGQWELTWNKKFRYQLSGP